MLPGWIQKKEKNRTLKNSSNEFLLQLTSKVRLILYDTNLDLYDVQDTFYHHEALEYVAIIIKLKLPAMIELYNGCSYLL